MAGPTSDLRRAVQAAGDLPPVTLLGAVAATLAAGRRLPAWAGASDGDDPRLDAVRDAAAGRPPEALGEAYEALLALDDGRRRSQGSHYTPGELAGEVVEHTLAPWLTPGAPLPRVCDPALGGGVFLLQAVRLLAHHQRRDPREVAEACLYGVDCDPLAVTVARLVLWLETGADLREQLRVGDALVGPLREPVTAPPVPPFDWRSAFPEAAERGFDAVVGNPPFLGGSFISGALGTDYRDHLVREVARRKGNADLCAYFVLRAYELLRPGGRAGLVTTNTIAEGETREVGLGQLVERGAVIDRAERLRRWPGEASLCVSLIWLRKPAPEDPAVMPVLDGREVPLIDDRLHAVASHRRAPQPLPENLGRAFNGTKIYGQGFLLTPAEAQAIVAEEPRYADVLLPYLSGDDLYGRPDRAPSRWVICFHDWPLERAREYPRCLEQVERRVKPERDRLHGRNPIGTRRAEAWWQFGSGAPALYRAAAGRERVLAKVLHSHTHAFVPVPARAVFSHGLAVIVDDDPALLAVLQSELHQAWSVAQGSSLGDAPRWTLSKTFETFPLPRWSPALRELGQAYEAHRLALADRLGEGLTRLYARVHDPADEARGVTELRALQAAVDTATVSAYGWADLALVHDFRETAVGTRFGLAPGVRAELLDRLADLNEARTGAAALPFDDGE